MRWITDTIPVDTGQKILPYGLGRSYGDSCLNDGAVLLITTALNRFIALDNTSGILRCEAGVTLAEILSVVVARGWFLPVTPGTKFVTVGGAVANDVHGKNHHGDGTFGRYVKNFALLRSDGIRYLCSPTQNQDLFQATIGGLGLTGLILWVEFQLIPIHNPFLDAETVQCKNLSQFFELSQESEEKYQYTVAWIDCLARGRSLGRGIFIRGNHAHHLEKRPPPPSDSQIIIPVEAPSFLLNRFSIRAFNFLYYHKQRSPRVSQIVHLDPFFYPLDAIGKWNRLYGRRGFFQYQCVVPYEGQSSPIRRILETISQSGMGSFLAVLKVFGDKPSPGILSFPKKGITLALDFPNQGRDTLELLERLDQIVRANNGAVYPAKDARMSAASFQTYFPRWQEFAKYVDPHFSSSFWRRVIAPHA
jgi:FAD/FMN-containing dehydrogenase